MARPRFAQLPRERQEEILRVAATEFAQSGFQGTSYNQLLEKLRLGKSSAYYYFENKRDLFLTAIAHCYQRYFEKMGELPPATDADHFWLLVRQGSEFGFDFMREDPTAAKLFQCVQREPELLAELLSDEVSGSMVSFYDHILSEGSRVGAVRSDLPIALLTSLVMNLALTFDQWFIAASAESKPPGSAYAAELFTEVLRRLVS
jgi:AcrR family transcriptional regulator